MLDTTGDRSLTGRRGEDHRLGLCYTMLLGGLQCTLFYMLQDEVARSVVFKRTSYPPVSRLSVVHSTYNSLIPVDTNAYICSVAPCLRVLRMSTHGCFAPPFFPFLYSIAATRRWSPGARRLRRRRLLLLGRCLLLRAAC